MTSLSERPLSTVRRKDREVADDVWIAEMLRTAPTGVLATVHDGVPFINTNLFAYDADEHAIYMHTARGGRTRDNVDAEERVCFSVFSMGRLLPAEVALEMSVEYTGVVVFGRARVLGDATGKRRALELLLTKYFGHLRYGEDYREMTDEELARTAAYRITIDEWSGKKKQVGDHPGAFLFGERG